MSIRERFLKKVNKTGSCWLWMAANRGNGYGCMKINGEVIDAHRISYILFVGPIPYKKLVCHTCDNRLCVNPGHLFVGTYSDNMQDCSRKNRINKYHSPESTLKQALKLRKWNEKLLHCSICQKMLDRSKFHKNKHRSSGYMSECKKCRCKNKNGNSQRRG